MAQRASCDAIDMRRAVSRTMRSDIFNDAIARLRDVFCSAFSTRSTCTAQCAHDAFDMSA
jgi:hypothetical protein